MADSSGIAFLSDSAETSMVLNTDGPCLRGTVQALLDDPGDAGMAPEHEVLARSEARRFAEAILEAYVKHYGTPDEAAASVKPGFPTGLLYGCVQSGKTRAITLTSAMLFDNGIRVVVILTSNNVELVEQTTDRLRLVEGVQFLTSLEYDRERLVRDRDHIAAHLVETGLLVVCQKERHHQRELISFLQDIGASELPAVIFDDEADQATPDTTLAARASRRASAPQHGSTTYRLTVVNDRQEELGESLAETLRKNVFVQVTATPYAMLLQHINHPLRPVFTRLIEPGDGYLGGEWFFPQSALDAATTLPLVEVPALEANSLVAGAMNEPPELLRQAVAYFCVVAAVADLGSGHRSKYGYSFLCHTSSKTADHAHLERLIAGFLDQVSRDWRSEAVGDVSNAFTQALAELSKTVESSRGIPYRDIRQWILKKLPLRNMRIINAEGDSLNLSPGLNFLIGGNILGRGLTIRRLLVTYYMRHARVTKMDTMLQHARMFGYRSPDRDLIRVYLPRTSIRRFVGITRAERELRELLRNTEQGAIPIRMAQNLAPARRNILDTGFLDAYREGEQLYPYDPEFEPEKLKSSTDRLTATMDEAFGGSIRWRDLIEIEWNLFRELVKSVRIRSSDDSRWLPSAIANLSYILQFEGGPPPMLWCRQMPRRGGPQIEGAAGGDDPSAKSPKACGRLILMMFRSPGDRDLGWAGAPFWYPTVQLPAQMGAFLFNSSE
jgi:hypothetical protein